VFVEKWASREHLDEHFKKRHLKVWRDVSGPHVVSRKIEIVYPEKVDES